MICSFCSFISFAENLRALTGWRRAGVAFLFGAIGALAFPPVSFFPVLWLCFPAAIFLLQGTKNMRQAFVVGWSFAFGCFLFSLYWIAAAMFVDIRAFWWAVPLAVAGLPAFFGVYYGFAAALARRIGLSGISGVIVFALLWFLADYVRGHLFTGFPWNLEGYAWTRALLVLQVTGIIGIYGLTLLTLIAASMPAVLADDKKRGCWAVAGCLILFVVLAVWGEWRLMQDSGTAVPQVRLRIVQPDTDQAHKWEAGRREENFRHLLDLSVAPGAKPVTHIIWPETAATFYLVEDDLHRRVLATRVPKNGAIITGVIRRDLDAKGQLHYFNSLVAVDRKASIATSYDKFHLVPFGEYIPLRSVIPLHTLANLGLDFTPGDGLHSLRVPGLPAFSPLVCYEAIFSGEVADPANRPEFLLNVTNDGWYGHTPGPYQHFAVARVRAIEEGLPLVRAANTGVSGVVDPYGRIIARLGLGKSGFVDADLPQPLPPTVFSRLGEKPLWAMFIILAAGVLQTRARRKR